VKWNCQNFRQTIWLSFRLQLIKRCKKIRFQAKSIEIAEIFTLRLPSNIFPHKNCLCYNAILFLSQITTRSHAYAACNRTVLCACFFFHCMPFQSGLMEVPKMPNFGYQFVEYLRNLFPKYIVSNAVIIFLVIFYFISYLFIIIYCF
jgi:hypothetical protein